MNDLVSTRSPIPWPKSDKKRKPKSHNPDNFSPEASTKLSSKKSSTKKDALLTPKSTLKYSSSRRSLETFQRVYSEMIGSPRESPVSGEKTWSSSTTPHVVRKSTCQDGYNTPKLDRSDKKSVIDFLDTIGDTPRASTSSVQVSRAPPRSSQSACIVLSSSDEDSFSLPPPLSQRVLAPSGSLLRRELPLGKSPSSFLSDSKSGKNIQSSKSAIRNSVNTGSTSEEALKLSKLKTDEVPDFPKLPVTESMLSMPRMLPRYNKMGKENISVGKHKPRRVIFDSSSEDELPDLPKLRFDDKQDAEDRFSEKHFLLDDELPDLDKVSSDKNRKVQKPLTVASPFDDELPDIQNITLSNRKTNTKPVIIDDSTSDDELPDIKNITLDKRKTNTKPVIFDDSSSEDELPNLPKTNITARTPKLLPTSLQKPKVLSTVPRTVHQGSVLTSVQETASPAMNGTHKVWINQESVTEICKFLKSLSDAAPIETATSHFRKQFSKHKDDLVKLLYQYYNNSVFEKKLPADMSITWNIRLTKTAGYCYMRTHRDQSRSARIELSTKVLDRAERVRDTLLHEMCHAAAFLVFGYRDGHGPIFKHWAKKSNIIFPFLPVVTRCHTYQINTKYVYKCTTCHGSIGRHSKSIDITKKVCGRCRGKFVLLVNGVVCKT